MSAWLTAAGAGIVMYLLRAGVPLAAGSRALPERVVSVTRLVAPAVISALLAGSLVAGAASGGLWPRLAVLGAGFAVALRTRSIPLTIGAGLGTHLLTGVLS